MVTEAELEAVKRANKEPELFIMSDWYQRTSCGTAYCIGGWLETLYPKKYCVTHFLTTGNFPCTHEDIDTVDTRAKLFHVDDWYKFISNDLLNEIEESLEKYTDDEYLDNDSFDELPNKLKKDFACKVIDEYIAHYKNRVNLMEIEEIRKTIDKWNPDSILSLKVIDYPGRICTSKIDKNSNERILKKIKLFKKFEI